MCRWALQNRQSALDHSDLSGHCTPHLPYSFSIHLLWFLVLYDSPGTSVLDTWHHIIFDILLGTNTKPKLLKPLISYPIGSLWLLVSWTKKRSENGPQPASIQMLHWSPIYNPVQLLCKAVVEISWTCIMIYDIINHIYWDMFTCYWPLTKLPGSI